MLNIFYGDMKEAVYNTAAYFKYDYEDSWIVDPFVKEMIQDVDRSTVLDSGCHRSSPGSWEDTTNRTIRWSENTDSC